MKATWILYAKNITALVGEKNSPWFEVCLEENAVQELEPCMHLLFIGIV